MISSHRRLGLVGLACVAGLAAGLCAATAAAAASDGPFVVKQSRSGICHCPGGDSYAATTRYLAFGSIEACLEADGRHPKRGQGECAPPVVTIDPAEVQSLKMLVATQRVQIAGLISDIGANEDEISGLRGELAAWEEHAREQEARADRAESRISDALAEGRALETQYGSLVVEAERDRNAAAGIRQEAELVLREAEEREHGAGPPARRACREALKLFVIDASTGWLSSSVKVDEEERAALSAACLGIP